MARPTSRQGTVSLSSDRRRRVKLSWRTMCSVLSVLQLCLAIAVYLWTPSLQHDDSRAIVPPQFLRERAVPDKPTSVTEKNSPSSNENQKSETMPQLSQNLVNLADTRPDADLAENLRLRNLEEEVRKKHRDATNVLSCRWYRRHGDGVSPMALQQSCLKPGANLVAYNQASYARTWCGQKLPPKGTAIISLQSTCQQEPARIQTRTPTANNAADMPSIQISSHPGGKGRVVPFRDCDVPCENVGRSGGINQNLHVVGTDWKFVFSMEGTKYYPHLRVDPNAHLNNNFYATTSFQAEIPLPYFSWAEYNISKPAVDFDKVIPGASFMARNCNSKNNRETRVKDLMKYIRVDSLSSCMNNAKPPNNIGLRDKALVQAQYMLHLAFENSCDYDYVTEKLFGTYVSGSLPVYLGAPNIYDHVPPHSIIAVDDFNSTEELGLYRMCRWAYSRKYGLGWDHESQTVLNLAVPRELQIDPETGTVQTPFIESWRTLDGRAVPTIPFSTNNAIVSDSWRRSAFEHDGVFDLHFEKQAQGPSLVYKLETNVKGQLIKSEKNEKIWQDKRTRVTVVKSWVGPMEFTNGNAGTIEVTFDDATPALARIRIVLEGVDSFHKTGQNRTYYFGHEMTKDFFQPVEFFVLEGFSAATR